MQEKKNEFDQKERVLKESFERKISFYLIAACSLGTILEWYDFSLYAYLAPIISVHYFPTENKTTSIMLTYSIFAIGFFARPIGAIIFGHFGDRIGRKKVLIASITLMAAMTCLIGFLPTYKEIGLMAPALLILLRILQGIAIGGETIGAGSLVIESAQSTKRGYATALVWSSSGIGILLSSIVICIATWIFSQHTFSSWAWRVPFLLGGVTGIIGYYLRKNISESKSFKFAQDRKEIVKIPIIEAIIKFKKEILITVGLYVLCAITTYLIFVYMPVYASKTIGLPFNQAMGINTITMTIMVLLVPLVGKYSDFVGRKIILLASAIGFLVLSYPLYQLIADGNLLGLAIAQLIFAILTAGFHGSITSAVLEMFPSNVRYSAAAVGYNISYSLFGGTVPLIAVYLISKLQYNLAPSLYLIFGAAVAIVAVVHMKETYKEQLV